MNGILDWLMRTREGLQERMLPMQQRMLEMRAGVQSRLQDQLARDEMARLQEQASQQAPGVARVLGALPEARGLRGQTPSIGSGWQDLPPELASTVQLLMDPATQGTGLGFAAQLLSPQGRAELERTRASTMQAQAGTDLSRFQLEQAQRLGPLNYAAELALVESRRAATAASQASAQAAAAGKMDQVTARLQDRWLRQMVAPVAVQDSLQQIDAALDTQDSLGALAAVIKLAKILDPTSVVREGEVTTVEGGIGIADQLVRNYNRLKGEGFSGGGVKSLRQTALAVAAPVLSRGSQITAEFRGLADASGVPADQVVTGIGWDDAYSRVKVGSYGSR